MVMARSNAVLGLEVVHGTDPDHVVAPGGSRGTDVGGCGRRCWRLRLVDRGGGDVGRCGCVLGHLA
jgi:hypothetical protein